MRTYYFWLIIGIHYFLEVLSTCILQYKKKRILLPCFFSFRGGLKAWKMGSLQNTICGTKDIDLILNNTASIKIAVYGGNFNCSTHLIFYNNNCQITGGVYRPPWEFVHHQKRITLTVTQKLVRPDQFAMRPRHYYYLLLSNYSF